jgi:hypothetical protein
MWTSSENGGSPQIAFANFDCHRFKVARQIALSALLWTKKGTGHIDSLPAGQVMGSPLDSWCLDGKDPQTPCQWLIDLGLYLESVDHARTSATGPHHRDHGMRVPPFRLEDQTSPPALLRS